ncbi:Gfo/Idh/MocA family protein [Leptolyngbya ohadii]|uniref:Gfo/Idh/MocA family protein n=1 Tax=Leptolyngbya ohadii TaxID=1962290 RepID=UPI000B598FDB|nr:Gfo/Idh/MocA family oxidoreductase [Leptolyngbya ohadii]
MTAYISRSSAVIPSAAIQSALIQTEHPSTLRKTVKLAVIGAGRWGTHLVRNFLALPQAELVAVVDPNGEQLQSLPQRLGDDGSLDNRLLLTDWRAALDLPDLDAIVVATPAISHFPLIEAALLRGCHVLAEKPLTIDPAEARQLCQLAVRQQRQLVVDHTYLFHPAVQQGRQMIRAGELGELRYGYASRTHLGPVRQDVDALWDLAVHDIAIFNSWTGETPIAVQAQGMNWLQSGIADLVWVKLTYPNGFEAIIHLCWSNPDKQRRLCMVGDRGTLVFDELTPNSPLTFLPGNFENNCEKNAPFNPIVLSPQVIAIEPVEPLQQVCHHFLDCVESNQPSDISSGELGADLVEILAALTQSINQKGQLVSLRSDRSNRSGI